MKKVKLLFISLTALLSIFVLSGCGKKAYPVGTPQNPYKIVWYTIGPPQKDLPMVEKKANEYLRKKIGAVLDIRMIGWGEYDKKLNIVLISGGKYDLCFTSSWTNNYSRNAIRGAFLPLNKLLDKYGQGIKKSLNPAFLEGPKINGELYAIPTNKEVAQQMVYMFNNNILTQNGYSIKDFKPYDKLGTLKSIIPYMESVKKNNPGVTPFNVDKNTRFILHDFTYILDNYIPGAVKLKKGNYKVINQFESKEYFKQFELYHEMYQKGLIPRDAAQMYNTDSKMLTGKAAVSGAQYQPCASAAWTNEYGYKVVSIPRTIPVINNSSVEGAMVAISVNAKRPDIDMKFLNLLNTDKYLRNLLGYGIKGIQYEKTGPNSIKYLPAHKNYLIASFALGNLFITYLTPGDPANKWEQFKTWNATAVKSQILGFHFDITPVSSEMAAITNVCQQYTPGLFTGTMNPKTYLPKFKKALENAGLKKFLAEEQKQLNEWVKNVKYKKEQNNNLPKNSKQ
ncbi:MAG TPA: ABC transporter substrate-binding protein [Victivallales bacterium]|nr:ABC transporter substrate-binding protein [Victivallales bacterium]